MEPIPINGLFPALRKHFNLYQDTLRLLAIVSPICGPCLAGAQAIKEGVLKKFPGVNFRVGVAWINMLEGDNLAAARRAASMIDDPRLDHFYSEDKEVGKAIAQGLGGDGQVAWDIYLYYAPGQKWEEEPPQPVDWFHQLGPRSWADPARFRWGQDLVIALHDAMQNLIRESSATQSK